MSALNIDDPEWFDDAACRDVPQEVFFPDTHAGMRTEYAEAKLICGACPYRADCLEHALRLEESRRRFGVWGGMSPSERRYEHNRRFRAAQ